MHRARQQPMLSRQVCRCLAQPIVLFTQVLPDLSSRVSWLNPMWNEKDVDIDERFKRAMALTGQDFMHFVTMAWKVSLY